MIQILGLRDYLADGQTKKREVFFGKGWRFKHVREVFDGAALSELLASVPEDEQFNLYFTVADCFEERGRKLKEQWALPFDIDGLHIEDGAEREAAEAAARAGADALGLSYDTLAVVFTGNGVQFFVPTTSPIIDDNYFDVTREAYGLLANRIQRLLVERGIQGSIDTSVWSRGRLMRLPNTYNVKPGKPKRRAFVLQEMGTPVDYDILVATGVTNLKQPEIMADSVLKNYPKPDTEAVCSGCKFLQWCKSEPQKVTEPQWYAMTSITARLDNGSQLTHEYSAGHPGYSHYETENKIEQSLAASGPRTCKDISSRWNGCDSCDYHEKVTSPIMIKGANFIASKDFGFRERKQSDKGGHVRVIPGKPVYTDLIKHFQQLHPYRVVLDNDSVYIYNGKHWEEMLDRQIKVWMTETVRPEPSATEMNEFVEQLKSYNTVRLQDMYDSKDGKMNFQNCVLDVMTGEVTTHSPEYGFFGVIPYPYDERAEAPTWEKFLSDIMSDDMDMVQVLKEIGGYAISGDEPWSQWAPLFVGDGANGKSVFVETLGLVVGKDGYSSVGIRELVTKDTMRYLLVNKLFNYSEESAVNNFGDSEVFKALIGGGEISVKRLYSQPYQVRNTTKVIMCANQVPSITDFSDGMRRRFMIINFKAKFKPGDGRHDYFIKEKLRTELPGICNSLLRAYKEFKTRGILHTQDKVTAVTNEALSQDDSVSIFIQDCLLDHAGGEEKVLEVYQEYVRMCELTGLKAVNNVWFGRRVAKLGVASKVIREDVGCHRVYINVKLRKDY